MRKRFIVLFGVGLAVACSFDLPEGPDLAWLASAYDRPDGLLNEENVEAIVEAAQTRLEQIENLSSLDFVVETLVRVSEDLQDFSNATPDSRFKIDISSETETPCPGIGGGNSPSEDRGNLGIALVVEASQLRPTIWGQFEGCQFDLAGARVALNSTIQIYLDGNLALHALEVDSYLFELVGDIRINDAKKEGRLDFRAFADRALEVRVPAETGHVVMNFATGASREASVRTGAGSFCCHFDERRCTQVSGNSCASPETGDEEIRW